MDLSKYEYGPNRDLRIFFEKLLKECLGTTSGTAEISDYKAKDPRRPFTNAFNSNKQTNKVFTRTNCCNFLEFALRKNTLSTAVKIIHESEYGVFLKNLDTYNFKKLKSCSFISPQSQGGYCKCIDSILNKENFRDSCQTCPVKLIFESLPYIESEYHISFIKEKIPLKNYASSDDETLVTQIYEKIQAFENDFQSTSLIFDDVCTLFNSCIRCADIYDISDFKLAFIKWYTARLCTWPYFKSCLLRLGKYNEFTIHSLLQSASNICKSIPMTEIPLELLYNIVTDKIVSYISLAYQTPFATNYESPEEILENCSQLLKETPGEPYQSILYTEMWNLAFHTNKNPNIYAKKIKNLLQHQKSHILGERYYTYLYIYNLCSCDIPKELLLKKARQLRDQHSYNDTLDVTIELFLSKALSDSNFFDSGNPYLDINAMKGYKFAQKIETDFPTSPALYQRIYGDNTLTNFFQKFKNLIK